MSYNIQFTSIFRVNRQTVAASGRSLANRQPLLVTILLLFFLHLHSILYAQDTTGSQASLVAGQRVDQDTSLTIIGNEKQPKSGSPTQDNQTVGLVLSGGGAKGLFHIGVIKALEENDIPIDYITGTSMGAIVGGLYAMGYSPDDMIAFFSSGKFDDLLKGSIDSKYRFFSQQMDETPEMFSIWFDLKKWNFRLGLPTNLIQPYVMDLEFLRICSGATALSKGNFDHLMVPFRCVASDISRHTPYVIRSGDLGTAIRASMAFPFVFKPVMIDSILLFDGGFYNNFPWDVMQSDFNPSIIIGSQCVGNVDLPEELDILSQVSSMLTYNTNFEIPDSLGISIQKRFEGKSLLDFYRLYELVDSGYYCTIKNMDKIKARINSRRSPYVVDANRRSFIQQQPDLLFKGAKVTGLSALQNRNVERTLTRDLNEPYSLEQMKTRYFGVLANNNVSVFFPTAVFDSISGYFEPNVRAMLAPRYRLAIGGNISSAAGNMVYVGFETARWKKTLVRFRANAYLGRLYSSAQVGIRQNYPLSIPLFSEAYMTLSGFDYYRGSQNIFYENIRPIYLKEYDSHFAGNLGTGLTKNSKVRLGFAAGYQSVNYYVNERFKSTDIPDETSFPYTTVHFTIDKNTLDFKQFPTDGHLMKLSVRTIWGREHHVSGSTVTNKIDFHQPHGWSSARAMSDFFFTFGRHLSLGLYTEVVVSTSSPFVDYHSTITMLPVFQPTPHSKTFFLEAYRANSYAAVGLEPSIKFNKNLYLQGTFHLFQPYREILSVSMGKAVYSDPFPRHLYIASAAAVWQSPAGPLSVSINYYSKNYSNYYFLFNFGYIIFNKKGIDY